jgi:hypothetical protein
MRVRPFPALHSSLRELNAVLSLSILLSSTFFELIMLPLAPRPISARVRSCGQVLERVIGGGALALVVSVLFGESQCGVQLVYEQCRFGNIWLNEEHIDCSE